MSTTPPTHTHAADGSSEIARRLQDDVASARAQVAKFEAEYAELLADPGVNQEDRDGTRTLLEAARATAAAAERALERFESGSYGICAKCGKPIAPERLEAIPDTVTCVSCQGAPSR
jgi:RNA polymerase-binding transcription factor DksA